MRTMDIDKNNGKPQTHKFTAQLLLFGYSQVKRRHGAINVKTSSFIIQST